MLKPMLISAAVLLFIPNLINSDINATEYSTPAFDQKEKFDPSLSSLNTLDKLDAYITKATTQKALVSGTVEYVEEIKNCISNRFYHGFSHLSLNEDWIAASAEKIVGYGLSCNVNPDEIIKHPNAACSQQCIVMMEILRRRNIDYRSVGFPHHYAIEVRLNNNWYYFDPNMEPNIPNEARLEASWKGNADNLKKYYDNSRYNDLDYKFGNGQQVTFGPVNERPAKKARFFQTSTKYVSKILWCVPLLILLYRRRKFAGPKFYVPVIKLHSGKLQPLMLA